MRSDESSMGEMFHISKRGIISDAACFFTFSYMFYY